MKRKGRARSGPSKPHRSGTTRLRLTHAQLVALATSLTDEKIAIIDGKVPRDPERWTYIQRMLDECWGAFDRTEYSGTGAPDSKQ